MDRPGRHSPLRRPVSAILMGLMPIVVVGWLRGKWVKISVEHGSDVHVYLNGVKTHDEMHGYGSNYVDTYMHPLWQERHSVFQTIKALVWTVIAVSLFMLVVQMLGVLRARYHRIITAIVLCGLFAINVVVLWLAWTSDASTRSTYTAYVDSVGNGTAEITWVSTPTMVGQSILSALYSIVFVILMLLSLCAVCCNNGSCCFEVQDPDEDNYEWKSTDKKESLLTVEPRSDAVVVTTAGPPRSWATPTPASNAEPPKSSNTLGRSEA